MWKIVTSCFLSVAVLGGTYVDADISSVETYATPETAITFPQGEFEVENYRLWNGVGRHEMVKINSAPQYIGQIPVQYFFPMHEISIMDNEHMKEEYTSVTTTSVSISRELRLGAAQNLSAEIKVDGASIGQGGSLNQTYTIQNTQTYTTAHMVSETFDYDINAKWFEGKYQYAVGIVAFTYKIQAETWAWDDYWWGDYEVSGSRKSFDVYVVYEPVITLIYGDNTYLYNYEIIPF